MVALLALTAWAAPQPEVRWEPVDAAELGELPLDTALRARCDQPPVRWGLDGDTKVERIGERPAWVDGWWLLPLGPAGVGGQGLPEGCAVERQRVQDTAWTWAREEEAGRPRPRALLSPAEASALERLGPSAWSTLVPPGPEPSGWHRVPHRGDEGAVQGPARIRVEAPPTAGGPTCLWVDGLPSCRAPSEAPARWLVGLGSGRHSLRWPEGATATAATPASPLPQGAAQVILLQRDAERWASQPGGAALVLDRAGPPDRQGPRWAPLGDGPPPLDPEGRAALWITSLPCALESGGRRMTLEGEAGLHLLDWTGEAPAPPLTQRGCGAWVREDPGEGEGVVSTWTPLDQGLRWEQRGLLQLRVARDLPDGAQLSVVQAGGAERLRLTALPSDLHPGIDAGGRQWAAPVSLPVAVPGEVFGEAGLLGRVLLPERPAAPPSPLGAPPSGTLREASQALAAAGDDASRAAALRHRAALLAQRGARSLAARDLAVAEALSGEAEGQLPGLRAERLRAATGAAGWVPPPQWAVDGEPEGAVRAGDYLSAAGASASPVLRWRQALAGGQVLSADQRIAAWTSLQTLSPQDAAHPWLWPLRAASGWETVGLLEGARRAEVHLPPQPRDALEGELFPEAWPEEHTADLSAAAALVFPAVAAPTTLRVRCLATRAPEPCTFTLRDRRGATRAEVIAAPWGGSLPVVIPADPGAMRLEVSPAGGVIAQALIPAPLPTSHRGWLVGRAATVELLGPTALRLRLAGEPGTARLWVDGALRQTAQVPGEVVLPLPEQGPQRVRLEVDHPTQVVAELRVPDRSPRPLDTPLSPAPPARIAPPALAEVWPGPAQPVRRPPLTALGRASGGVGDADGLPELRMTGVPWLRQEVGIRAREGGRSLGADLAVVESTAGAHLLGDLSGAWRGAGWRWVPTYTASLRGVGGLAGAPLVAGELRGSVGADRRVGRWQTDLELEAWARGGGGSTLLLPTAVWSAWRQSHPWGLSPRAELHHYRGRWAQEQAWAAASSEPDLWRPARVSAGLRADRGAPGLWGSALGELSLYPGAAVVPRAQLRAATSRWPARDLGLIAEVRAGWQGGSGLLGELRLTALGSRDRGLDDLPPAERYGSHALAWEQHRLAEEGR